MFVTVFPIFYNFTMKDAFLKCNASLSFESEKDLLEGFGILKTYVQEKASRFPNVEVILKLNWTPKTLKKSYHRAAIIQIRDLQDSIPNISVVNFFPFCLNEEGNYSTFPDCKSCVFYESMWCLWPRHSEKIFVSPQMDMSQIKGISLTKEHFSSHSPITWMTPQKKHLSYIAKVLSKFDTVYDFGCGNGFISSLLLEEGLTANHIGIDPFITPNLDYPNFKHQKEIQEFHNSSALFSSQADKGVPLDNVFKKGKPGVVAFLLLPDLFGGGGQETIIEINSGHLKTIKESTLFDLRSLDELGYQLAFQDKAHSFFWEKAEVRIYALPEYVQDVQETELVESEAYSWEKTLLCNSSTTSEDSLS